MHAQKSVHSLLTPPHQHLSPLEDSKDRSVYWSFVLLANCCNMSPVCCLKLALGSFVFSFFFRFTYSDGLASAQMNSETSRLQRTVTTWGKRWKRKGHILQQRGALCGQITALNLTGPSAFQYRWDTWALPGTEGITGCNTEELWWSAMLLERQENWEWESPLHHFQAYKP